MRNFIILLLLVIASVAQAETLQGIVLQQDGNPAPGAEVTAAAVFESPPLRIHAKADESGKFQLDLPRLTGSSRYMLAIRWESQGTQIGGSIDATGDESSFRGQAFPPFTVHLRPEGRLHGRLLQAEDDTPIAGAQLFLDTGEVLSTNAAGEFHINGLPMEEHSLIPVASDRVRQHVLFDTTSEPQAKLELKLPRGAVVRGTITDENGMPIPGAYISRASSGTALTLNGWDEACAEDGSFKYGGLSTLRPFYNLQAYAPGYELQTLSADVHDPAQVIRHNVQLKRENKGEQQAAAPPVEAPKKQATATLPRRNISGVVHDQEGNEIAGASVRWGAAIWDQSVAPSATNSDGEFTLMNIAETSGAVLVIAEGFAPEFAAVSSEETLEVVLSAGGKVKGIVTSTSGYPVAGAKVSTVTQCAATGFCNQIWLDERSTHTDEHGEFEIAAVPNSLVSFDILKDGFTEERGIALKTDGSLNEIKLKAGGAIEGMVVDQGGKSVRDFLVRVRIPRKIDRTEKSGGYYAGFDWYGVTFTRDDGIFTLTDIGAEHWMRLLVSSPGIGIAVLDRVQSHALDSLPPVTDLRIELQPFTPLDVKVLDARTQEPIADAVVSLIEDKSEFSHGFRWGYDDLWAVRQRTDPTGVATFSEPACEDGTIFINTPGYERKRVTWTDGSDTLTVLLQPEGRITGEVQLDGQRIGEGRIRLTSDNNDSFASDIAGSGGHFEFDQLPAGNYSLMLSHKNRHLHSERIKLQAGGTKATAIAVASSPE